MTDGIDLLLFFLTFEIASNLSDFSTLAADLLGTQEHFVNIGINKEMNKENLVGVVTCTRHRSLHLFAIDVNKLNEAEAILKSKIKEKTVSVNEGVLRQRDVPKFQEVLSKLEASNQFTFLTVVKKNSVQIAALDTELNTVEKRINVFLADHEIISRFVALEFGEFEFLQNFRKQCLIQMCKDNVDVDVELIDDPLRKGYVVRGQKVKCRDFINRLQVVRTKVSCASLNTDCPDVLKYIESAQGKKALEQIQLHQGPHCVLKVCTQKSEKESSSHYLRDTKRADCTISKFVVSLHVGCAASLKADVLVNPSSTDFEHHSGVSGIIVDKGSLDLLHVYCLHVALSILKFESGISLL